MPCEMNGCRYNSYKCVEILQTEADPQVTSLLFEKEGFQDLSERLISVAGHRVTTDPVCMPFRMGRNLLCIYSKK